MSFGKIVLTDYVRIRSRTLLPTENIPRLLENHFDLLIATKLSLTMKLQPSIYRSIFGAWGRFALIWNSISGVEIRARFLLIQLRFVDWNSCSRWPTTVKNANRALPNRFFAIYIKFTMVVILISISRAFNSEIMINREKHIVKGFARSPWRSDECSGRKAWIHHLRAWRRWWVCLVAKTTFVLFISSQFR